MSTQPRASAARPPEPNDELFRQIKDLYSFFKAPENRRTVDQCTPDEFARNTVAHSSNVSIGRAPAYFARFWTDLSSAKRQHAFELVLGVYCETRTAVERDYGPIIFDRLRNDIGFARNSEGPRPLTAHEIDPVRRFNTLLRHLETLYAAPIDEREFEPYRALRRQLGHERRLLLELRAPPAASAREIEAAEAVTAGIIAEGQERVDAANADRVPRLEQVKAAVALLREPESLVPGPAGAHRIAVEIYLSRLDPGQRAAAVAQVRDFLFAACEDRALQGEALDPREHVNKVLAALHARDLGHTICAARLKFLVRYYKSMNAPEPVVEHFEGVVNQFCGDEWTRTFPQLALTQQWYAAGMVKSIIRHIQPLTARQVADQIATIFPLDSTELTSWAHSHAVERPRVLSLAHGRSTHRKLNTLTSATSAPSNRYFPQARNERW